MTGKAAAARSPRLLLAAVCLGAATFVGVTLFIRQHPEPLRADEVAAAWASDHVGNGGVSALTVTTNLAGNWFIICVTLAVAIYAYVQTRRWAAVGLLAMALFGQWMISNTVKFLIQRPRPTIDAEVIARGWSFPSGHSSGAAATYLAIAVVLGLFVTIRSQQLLIVAAVGLSLAVAVSRVLLGVHWVSDAVAGLLVGWTWFGICYLTFGGPHFRAKALGTESSFSEQQSET